MLKKFVRGLPISCSVPKLRQSRLQQRYRTQCVAKDATKAVMTPAQKPVLDACMSWPSRSHYCGSIREEIVGEAVCVCGWVDRCRNHGQLLFIDVRDQSGIVQIITDSDSNPDVWRIGQKLKLESVVCISGSVRLRQQPNPHIPTGKFEIVADEISLLNTMNKILPFPISGAEETESPGEETRLRDKILDLRRPSMASNLRLRHEIVKFLRRYLEDEAGFIEIETPILTKATPEGARDYLVPSRNQPGKCYALPQSPQLFKQMLMVAGFDR